ncbi:MAG TPA: hypothetical protein VKU00_09705 [Chthonomonadaceae bacterium]|nr:hypothetical protein [Chthonomonadaceae bacterium]
MWLLVVWWLLAGGQRAKAVDIDALIGFGQGGISRSYYRIDSWTPLTVYLTGQGVHGAGQLQVTVDNDGRTTVYTRPVSMREGFLKEAQTVSFVFPFRSSQNYTGMSTGKTDIHIQLLVDGRQVAQKSYTIQNALQVNSDAYNLLALNRDGSGLSFLSKKRMGLFHRHINPEITQMQRMGAVTVGANGINPEATLNVMYSRIETLPGMEQGYDLVDAIALADLQLDNLTESQLNALKTYVRNGGLMVLSGGGDMSRLRSQFFKDLLPLEPTGATVVHALPELTERYQEPLNFPVPISLTEGKLKPGAMALFNPAGRATPLICSWPYGSGIVVFTTFDYLDPVLRGWKAAPSLWRDMLRCGNESASPRAILAANPGSNQGGTLALEDALAGKQATSIPPFYVISIFIGAYLVLLIPVSYLLLKRLDRRELAWFTAPVLIVGFTVLSYLIARSIKGGALTVNRAVVLETGAYSDQVAGYGHFTVYSPRRTTYDIALSGSNPSDGSYRDTAPEEITQQSENMVAELKVDHDVTTTLRQTQINLWDKRSFETPVVTDLGGMVEAKTRMINSMQAEVTVTNKTRYTLRGCGLMSSANAVPIGDLAPGQTGTKTITWTYKEPGASALHIPAENVSMDPNATETPDLVRARVRQSLAQALGTETNGNNGYGREEITNFGRVPNAFYGWFYDPLLNITVDGKPTLGEEVNLLWVHLPMPSEAPVALRNTFNPFSDLPALNLEDVQPPGAGGGRDIFRGRL